MAFVKRFAMHVVMRGIIAFVLFGVICVIFSQISNVLAREVNGDVVLNSTDYTPDDPPEEDPPPVGWNSSMLSERELDRRIDGLDIRERTIPVMTPDFGAGYELINEQILDVVNLMISEARRVLARSLDFNYTVHEANGVISIVIDAAVASMPPRMLVRSVNFCPRDGRLLNMNQAMRMNIEPLTERLLAEKIRRDPARYYAALSVPLTSQAFYMTDEALVLLFDGFRLSPGIGGIYTIQLTRANIRSVSIPRTQYRVRSNGYSLKLIPVGNIARGLGYEVDWCGEERIVSISRGSQLMIVLTPGENVYTVVGSPPRSVSLETAPELLNGLTYVPITFFDQVFPITIYTVHSNGRITFIAYLEEL